MSEVKILETASPFDVWQPRERAIYHYFDGARVVAADPIRLQVDLCAEFDGGADAFDVELKIMGCSVAAEANRAMRYVAEHVRKIFQIEPLAGTPGQTTGLTDGECLDLLTHFFTFVANLKKNTSPSPISAPNSAAAASAGPSATPSTPASSSIATAPSSGGLAA